MSNNHTGNLLNQVTFEEHDGVLNAKRIVSAATIYAVVNTGAAGVQNSIVTVANFPAGFGGNVTLDVGSKTQIIGNLTLSDSKGFIGLTTTTLGTSPAFIGIVTVANSPTQGNVTLDDGSLTGIVGNLTLADSKGFIGLTTVVQASAARTITGNLTLSDSKGFIGLTTVKASILDTYASLQTLTLSIASLATSTTGVGRQSTLVDNSSTNYTSALVYLKIFTGGLAHTPNTLINVYLLRRDNNSVGDDGIGATDAAATFVNAPILGNILVNASNVSTSYYGVFDTSPLGPLGPQWGIGIVNQTGAALGGTESNHLKNWIGINRRLT